jgi:hypothetical protein
VENLVGYTRRNFMVPIPRAASWEALNEQFVRDAMARRAQRLRGHTETIGERFERDRAALLPLPAARFEACNKTTVRVSSISLVHYRTNDYSVPTHFGHHQVLVKAYVHRIVIVCGSEFIAEHARSYEREATVYDPLHYLALLEHKSRAQDQAAPLSGWQRPECFAHLRRLLEARLNKHASREYIQELRLLETFALEEVTPAIEDALRLSTISFETGGPSDRSSSLGWEYDKLARTCAVEKANFPNYLLRLTELELLDRDRRSTERRIRQAKFPVVKSLDSFDFLTIPVLNKTLVLELTRCEYLVRKENILLLGNSGTGKTHIALALGLAACQRGHRIRFITAAALVGELIEA